MYVIKQASQESDYHGAYHWIRHQTLGFVFSSEEAANYYIEQLLKSNLLYGNRVHLTTEFNGGGGKLVPLYTVHPVEVDPTVVE